MEQHQTFLEKAIQLACEGVRTGRGGPFGAVVVKNGSIIGQGSNQVSTHMDPTAHAEIVAIRAACQTLGHFQLDDCVLYSSCEPCPMCMGAIYWARPVAVYFAASRQDAAQAGFDDDFIYRELPMAPEERQIPGQQIRLASFMDPFRAWEDFEDKIIY